MEKFKVEKSRQKQRLYSIDLLKNFSVVLIFFFHCNMHLGVHFSALTPFISQGAIVMDLFFMLSGVCVLLHISPKRTDGFLWYYEFLH